VDDLLFTVHQFLGYALSVAVLLTASVAFGRAKNGQEFTAGLYRAVFGLLALHVLLGIGLYATLKAWDGEQLIAYVHPALGILALGVGQAMLGRARRTQMAVDAHRLAGRGLIVTLVLIVGAIGVASAV
jgi:hydrogenase/urease accessory protein HupE